MGNDESVKILGKSLFTDPSPIVRHEALLALATLGNKQFVPFIERYLKDPDKHISESAEIALERISMKD